MIKSVGTSSLKPPKVGQVITLHESDNTYKRFVIDAVFNNDAGEAAAVSGKIIAASDWTLIGLWLSVDLALINPVVLH